MNRPTVDTHDAIFVTCRRILGGRTWGRVRAAMDRQIPAEALPDRLAVLIEPLALPAYIADLARLEWLLHQKCADAIDLKEPVQVITVNPTLTLLPVFWKNLAGCIRTPAAPAPVEPLAEPGHVMLWFNPQTGELQLDDAEDIDLLALKLVVEHIAPEEAARIGCVTPGDIRQAVDRAILRGLLLSPGTRIRRTAPTANTHTQSMEIYVAADVFTLQWHITQACDLHCKHCYDRSDRIPLALEKALAVLADFGVFCDRMHVRGQVTFTGGNPLLYPHFEELYRAAARQGFGPAILGNPSPGDRVRRLAKIAPPAFFQISLEGLQPHNDAIRGKGHYDRSLAFLAELQRQGIYSMVMLTLTRDNLAQVLPLAERLQGKTDSFTFNRLSAVGEGAHLLMPEKEDFAGFLREYARAAAANPLLRLKDNLFNIIRREDGQQVFGGCTGYGCGAAFNFLSLLPDGEVHACRKFPSLVGNVFESSLYDIYRGTPAAGYRAGSRACRDCDLNLVCRGCLAVTHSLGLDVFIEKDPFCFVGDSSSLRSSE